MWCLLWSIFNEGSASVLVGNASELEQSSFREACIACVRGIFAARDPKSKERLVKELNSILKPIEAAGDPNVEVSFLRKLILLLI